MSIPRTPDGPGAGSKAGAPQSTPHEPADLGRVVLDEAGIQRAAKRMAHEILERNAEARNLALVAIARGGVMVGERIRDCIAELRNEQLPLGVLDVTLYRDDVIGRGRRPVPRRTRMPFSATGMRIILVEDVVFTGRTIRAAMDAVLDFGRPEAIQIATLVDRGHRELPIQVDFVGKNIPTARAERVVLRPGAGGGNEVVVL